MVGKWDNKEPGDQAGRGPPSLIKFLEIFLYLSAL